MRSSGWQPTAEGHASRGCGRGPVPRFLSDNAERVHPEPMRVPSDTLRSPRRPSTRSGFTLMELIVVVLILSVLGGALIPRVTERMAATRDARRLSDIAVVRNAIEQYHLDHGIFPPANQDPGSGGWDVSYDGNFIQVLLDEGYLREVPRDPINDATHHYRYYVYAQGSYGCVGDGPFYVLGIRNFETQDAAEEHPGYFQCSSRNWASEFDYVTGGGAAFR